MNELKELIDRTKQQVEDNARLMNHPMNPTTTESDSPAWKRDLSKFYGVMFEAGDYEALERFISEQVVKKIIKELEGMKKLRKPTHGVCCTCQTCGYSNEYDCECPRNEVLDQAIKSLRDKFL